MVILLLNLRIHQAKQDGQRSLGPSPLARMHGRHMPLDGALLASPVQLAGDCVAGCSVVKRAGHPRQLGMGLLVVPPAENRPIRHGWHTPGLWPSKPYPGSQTSVGMHSL